MLGPGQHLLRFHDDEFSQSHEDHLPLPVLERLQLGALTFARSATQQVEDTLSVDLEHGDAHLQREAIAPAPTDGGEAVVRRHAIDTVHCPGPLHRVSLSRSRLAVREARSTAAPKDSFDERLGCALVHGGGILVVVEELIEDKRGVLQLLLQVNSLARLVQNRRSAATREYVKLAYERLRR